jgi:hypothetical protein
MKIFNLTEHPEFISKISKWHYFEWKEFYPEANLKDFEKDIFKSLGA